MADIVHSATVPRWLRHGDRGRHRRRHLRLDRVGKFWVSSRIQAAHGVVFVDLGAGVCRPQRRGCNSCVIWGRRAVQRLFHRPGPRNVEPADRAARGQRPTRRRVPGGPRPGDRRRYAGLTQLAVVRGEVVGAEGNRRGALSFELAGGVEAERPSSTQRPCDSHVANIGDVRSLVITRPPPPPATLGRRAAQHRSHPGLVRLAVGLEGIDDILADLERGSRPLHRRPAPQLRPARVVAAI